VKINAPCRYSWTDLSAFGLEKFGSKWPACSAYYFEAGKRWGVNPLLLAFWGAVRSAGFTSKGYCQNIDIYALGGRYASYSDALSVGASELAKFDDTSKMQEQKEVEKLYAEFENFVSKLPPVVTPPKLPSIPAPKPVEPPVLSQPDKPEKKEPSTPTNWRKIAGWISGIASALAIVVVFTPTPIDDIVVRVLKILADLFSNM
jgi:hypothetical protein